MAVEMKQEEGAILPVIEEEKIEAAKQPQNSDHKTSETLRFVKQLHEQVGFFMAQLETKLSQGEKVPLEDIMKIMSIINGASSKFNINMNSLTVYDLLRKSKLLRRDTV